MTVKFLDPKYDEYLTSAEVAALAKVSKGTIRTWRSRQSYPLRYFIMGGRRVRYKRQDVIAFLEAKPRSGVRPKRKTRKKK
jgi:excisionase family DNA binding protein